MGQNESFTGRVDQLGRIVIPRAIRKKLRIAPLDSLEISLENGTIQIQKQEPDCVFCGDKNVKKALGENHVCDFCLKKLSEKSGQKEAEPIKP